MKKFHPPHIYQGNTFYFLTGRTIDRKEFFNTSEKKQIFLIVLKHAIKKFDYHLFAWIINNNHYHLLLKVEEGSTLDNFIHNIHANSARLLNQHDNAPGRQIWYQYWDRCIRSEEDFWKRFNYIHNNPIKHGYIKNLDELVDYPFSSYKLWYRKKGPEWLSDVWKNYSVIDFIVEGDN